MISRRFRAALAVGAAALAASAVAALPATPAAAGPVNCPGGTCDISLYQQITLGGDYGGPSAAPIALPPPPCWYIPYPDGPDAKAMAKYWFEDGSPPPDDPIVTSAILKHAHATWKNGKLKFHGGEDPGSWYALNGGEGNPGYMKCWDKAINSSWANVYSFVGPGQPPPPPPYIPPVDLAEYAANHQTIPTPTAVVSPGNKGYVNLATFAWGTWAASGTTGSMKAYKTTASLGRQEVTVWAVPSTFAVSISGGQGNVASNCTFDGSKYPVGHPPVTQPRTMPDCGVLPTSPTNGLNVSVTVTWTRTWGNGDLNGPGPNALPSATVNSAARTVPVTEIQSINKNG